MAAERGDAYAQYNLGVLYTKGRGVRQDLVQAHMWFSLAAAHGLQESQQDRDDIEKMMTPSKIAEAQRLESTFRPCGRCLFANETIMKEPPNDKKTHRDRIRNRPDSGILNVYDGN